MEIREIPILHIIITTIIIHRTIIRHLVTGAVHTMGDLMVAEGIIDSIMKSKHAIWLMAVYAGLLLLAATKFSLVSWIWGRAWSFEYLQYAYRNGWGYQYQSDYTFPVVLTYLAAFVIGIVGYAMAGKWIAGGWSVPAMILCVLGLISFLIEGSHWLWEHHLSWIAICPAASFLLAVFAIFRLVKKSEPSAEAEPVRSS